MERLKSCSFCFLAKNLIFILFMFATFNGGFFVHYIFADDEIPTEEDLGFTIISDSIFEDTFWSKEGSPYLVDTSIMIDTDATLTIEPGVVVKFNANVNNGASIYIQGKILANGTTDEPIYFTSNYDDVGGSTDDDYEDCYYEGYDEELNGVGEEICESIDWYEPSINDWNGLSFRNSTGSSFSNVFFKYAQDAVYIESSDISFENLHVSDSDSAINANKESAVKVSGGDFTDLNNAFTFYNNSSLEMSDSFLGDVSSGFIFYITDSYKEEHPDIELFDNSILKIKNTNIECEKDGITIFNNSSLDIKDSQINCLNDGIVLFNEVEAFLDGVKIFGAQDAGMIVFNNTKPDTLKVINSEITENNYGFVIWNTGYFSANNNSIHDNFTQGALTFQSDNNPVVIDLDFKNNWWGDKTGPTHSSNASGQGSIVSDNILFDPWLKFDPLIQEGLSSVMFIPGFQGSRVYKQSIGSLGTRYEDKLWEPNNSSDIEDLYMDRFGLSMNKDIYIRDIIEEATVFGLKTLNFYKSFSSQMDKMVDDGEILEWKPIAYDWRLSPNDVVEYGIENSYGDIFYNKELSADETPYIVGQLEELSNNSKTGKVTIVTHSNGGLVAKALISKLLKMKESGESDLIDKIDNLIIVAAPQLGTPKATAGILHGYDQGMMLNMLLGRKDARDFGQTLPGAYGLIPSQSYIGDINNKLILFDKSLDLINNWRSKYGDSIDSYEEFRSFLLDNESLRINPLHDDLVNPTILNEIILDKANLLHDDIDNIDIPDSVSVHQVAGWGLPTIYDFSYKSKNECSSFFDLLCLKKKVVLSSDVGFTSAGDGTVVGESALFGKGKEYYLNLKDYNDRPGTSNRDHVDIFEVSYLFDLIHNILKEDVTLPEYISLSSPEASSYTVLKMRSPVSMDIYDEDGLHTGLFTNSDEEVEIGIPNSLYLEFGEEKYVVVPTEGNYKLKLKGLSEGIFTLEEEIINEQGNNKIVYFKDVLTNPNLLGEVDIVSGVLASNISLDEDGDGVFEKVLIPTNDNKIEKDPEGKSISSGSYVYHPPVQELVYGDEGLQVNDLIINDILDNKEVFSSNINKENVIEEKINEEQGGSLLASVGSIDESNNPSLRVQIIIVVCFILLLLGLKYVFKVL